MGSGYRGRSWRDARTFALDRARYRCECCGGRHRLTVHHRDGRGTDGPRGYDPGNLTVLCHDCHNREHGRVYRPRRD